MRKSVLLAPAAALSLVLAACGGGSSTGSTSGAQPERSGGVSADLQKDARVTVDTSKWKKSGPYTIAALTQGPINGWGLSWDVSLKYAAQQDPNVEKLIHLPANGDANAEISSLENVVQQKPDAIMIDPLGRAALAAPVARASAAGIPVIVCGNGVEGKNYVSYVDVDLYHIGYAAAEDLAKALHGKGNVVMFSGISGVDAAETWKKAAQEAFGKYPGIKVVGNEYANWSIADGKEKATAMLSANPRIDGVWSGGSEMAIGTILAFKDAGRKMPVFSVTNPLNGFLRLAKENSIRYFAYPDPPSPIAKECLDTTIDVLKGRSVKKFVDVADTAKGVAGYDQSQTGEHYVPSLNDDFVPPATAPLKVYMDAGLGRK